MLATVAALGYANGLDNPLAHFGTGGPSDKLGLTTADAILNLPPEKNPIIADPLRLHDCSLVTDGAAFPASHLAVHAATLQPIAVAYRVEGGRNVVYRMVDAPWARPS